MTHRHFLVALTFLAFIVRGQTGIDLQQYQEFNSTMEKFLKDWKITGGSAAVTKDGRLIFNRSFGFANKENTELAKPYNLYRIASVSKPITSIAIMQLVERGELKLTDTVFGKNKILKDKYYTKVINDERILHITVQQLLEHTAGWERNKSTGKFPHNDPMFYPLHVTAVTEEANPVGDSTLIRYALQEKLSYTPGMVYSYSNIGYLVLGKIIEKISGLRYEQYVVQNIFVPLSIDDIRLGKNLSKDKAEREVEYISTYSTQSCYGDGSWVPAQYGGFNLEAMNAHGGWIATASDLTRLLLAVDNYQSKPDLLKPKIIELMTEPSLQNPYYSKGWSVNWKNNWWHTGSLDGSASFICRTSGGYTWAFIFNSRADNSPEFWKALDRLPWNCIKGTADLSSVDLFAPDKNVSGLQVSAMAPGSMNLSWVNGNGNGRIVIATETEQQMEFPSDGLSYKANSDYGTGAKVGTNSFVIYNGSGSRCMVTGLDAAKSYTFSAFEYHKNSLTGGQEVYKVGGSQKVKTDPAFMFSSIP